MKPADLVQHLPALKLYARYLAQNHADADDLVQSTVLRALRHPARYDDGQIASWLRVVMRSQFLDDCRRASTWRPENYSLDEEQCDWSVLAINVSDASARQLDVLIGRELGDEAIAALSALKPKLRRVVLAVDVRGASYRQAAEQLGLPVGTLMSRLHRARRLLREPLAEVARRDWGLARAETAPKSQTPKAV